MLRAASSPASAPTSPKTPALKSVRISGLRRTERHERRRRHVDERRRRPAEEHERGDREDEARARRRSRRRPRRARGTARPGSTRRETPRRRRWSSVDPGVPGKRERRREVRGDADQGDGRNNREQPRRWKRPAAHLSSRALPGEVAKPPAKRAESDAIAPGQARTARQKRDLRVPLKHEGIPPIRCRIGGILGHRRGGRAITRRGESRIGERNPSNG